MSSSPPQPRWLSTSELARRVRRLQIATDRLVAEGMAGGYASAFKGRGIEFAEVRPYQVGDDVRSLDWNVTARMGAPFVKQYVQERDLSLLCAIDISGSMGFGSRGILKRDLAAEVAVLTSFAALANGDRAGAALLANGLISFLPPRRKRNQVLRLAQEILQNPVAGSTDLEAGLSATLANLKRRSVLVLISDFVEASCPRALRAAASAHDVVVIEIRDPLDDRLPRAAAITVRDAETGRRAVVGHGLLPWPLARRGSLATRYVARRERQRQELARLTRQLRVGHLILATDRPFLAELSRFFARRRQHRG